MPTYEFWYDETYTNKAWFTADNEEQARELLGKLVDGEVEFGYLPNFRSKDKNYTLEVDNLTEIGD
jgi:hypothetical protein